jgi:hypothetical protein
LILILSRLKRRNYNETIITNAVKQPPQRNKDLAISNGSYTKGIMQLTAK